MKKIIWTSKVLMIFFYGCLGWIVASYMYSWIIYHYPVNQPMGWIWRALTFQKNVGLALPDLFTLPAPLVWKFVYSFETLMIFALYVMMSVYFICLFNYFSKAIIFEGRCIRLLKKIGFCFFAITMAHLLCPAINTFILSMNFDNLLSALYFGREEVTQLVIAFLVIVISWMMEEGKKMQDEQQLTI